MSDKILTTKYEHKSFSEKSIYVYKCAGYWCYIQAVNMIHHRSEIVEGINSSNMRFNELTYKCLHLLEGT